MAPIIHISGHGVYAPAVSAESVVLDIGAILGAFSREISATFGCSPIVVEANPALVPALRDRLNVDIMNVAVGGEDGEAWFNVSLNPEGSSLLDLPERSVYDATLDRRIKVRSISLSTLLSTVSPRPIDVLKMDIEGAEIAALASVSDEMLGNIGQLTIEFHDDPTFGFGLEDQVDRAVERLEALGLVCLQFNRPSRNNTLFLGPRLGLSRLEIRKLRLRYDYWRAVRHGLSRWRGRG